MEKKIQFYGKNFDLTEKIKDYIVKKVGRVLKQAGYMADDIRLIHVDLSRKISRSEKQMVRVEVNIDFLKHQQIIRAEAKAFDAQSAMDEIEEKLENQVRKYKNQKKDIKIKKARSFKKSISEE